MRLIPNNPITVLMQVLSRLMVIYLVLPYLWHSPETEWAVLMAAIPWCIAETVRYPFYQFTNLQPILGHLRYNLFIVLYPVGVSGELLCFYKIWQYCTTLPQQEKLWSFWMPNQINISFDFENCVLVLIPLVYLT